MQKQRRSGSNFSESIYALIYKNIVNFNLKPGTMISEKDISEKLNVSRTPVREAFIRLSQEGLVTIIPQKGTFVSKIDLARVQEERFLRESLECAVVELFADYHSEESIDRLRLNLKKQQAAIEQKDYAKFLDYDDQFHGIMFDETKKQLCYNLLTSFSGHYRRIRYLSVLMAGLSGVNMQHHVSIVEAVEQHDAAEASAIMRTHVRRLITEKDSICEQYPDYFLSEERFLSDADIFGNHPEFGKLFSSDT